MTTGSVLASVNLARAMIMSVMVVVIKISGYIAGQLICMKQANTQ
jgi:hypothetical protein